MAELVILYWRDIPAQVIARSGRKQAKRELAPRFQAAIDTAAMNSGAHDTDAYLAEWRRGAPESCRGDNLDEVAALAAERLEKLYTDDRLLRLIANHGRET